MFRPPDRAYSAVIQVPAVHQGICAPKKPPAVPSNAKERGYGNVNHDATLKLQIPRGTTPPLCRTPADRNASKYIDTEGLAKEARDRVGGRLPGALGGKSTLHLPVYYPDPNTATRYVAYPENIRPTFTELHDCCNVLSPGTSKRICSTHPHFQLLANSTRHLHS